MHQRIANATFQVIAGNSLGSGFSFIRGDLVVTNLHVVAGCCDPQFLHQINAIVVKTEAEQQIEAQILHVNGLNDFAIMKLLSPLPEGREILQPVDGFAPTRGTKLIFAGYPHGIPQLLTSEAIISAPLDNDRFALDGMINGGNSGGPIVDVETGGVVGVVTERRYLLGDAVDAIAGNAKALAETLKRTKVAMRVGAIDFTKINQMYAESLNVIVDALSQNANSGIGIGFPISPVTKAFENKIRNTLY